MEYTHACEEAAPQSSHKDFCNKHPKDSNKLGDRQDAAELRRVATLRRQHAEHLLEVVKKAEKREQERQKKLRHAPNKTHSEYLLKRWVTYCEAVDNVLRKGQWRYRTSRVTTLHSPWMFLANYPPRRGGVHLVPRNIALCGAPTEQ